MISLVQWTVLKKMCSTMGKLWWTEEDTLTKLIRGTIFGVDAVLLEVSKDDTCVFGQPYDFKIGKPSVGKWAQHIPSFHLEEERNIDHATFIKMAGLHNPYKNISSHLAF